jgi:glutamine amidotransferase
VAVQAAVLNAIARRVPVLGICLGMQWLFEGSDEAPDVAGLGLFPGHCFRLGTRDRALKVPHVGWNALERTARPSRLLDGVPPDATGYFTHAFAPPIVDDATATTQHGDAFTAVVERDRVFGVQWHPEKSGATGLRVVRNFLDAARGRR